MAKILLVKERLDGKGDPKYFVYEQEVWNKNKALMVGVKGDYRYRQGEKKDLEAYAKATGKTVETKEKDPEKQPDPKVDKTK
jgi:hypothetical protein